MPGNSSKWGHATPCTPHRYIPTRKPCCRRPSPYIPRHGGSALSCQARCPIPCICPPAAAFTPAARTPCPSVLWTSRCGRKSGTIKLPPVICMPDGGKRDGRGLHIGDSLQGHGEYGERVAPLCARSCILGLARKARSCCSRSLLTVSCV